ncbi:phage tail sheath family protein [Nocardioides gilvus]|uniref:phage tail sheath family protein n=1 Tax=Nocardioides gilvus TaxID=1735589 RepID=UPI00194E3D69|nr:phage tail sheath subtilisin-like domain-containing protein [Nocardioides gilvus]
MPEYLAPGVFVEETSFRQKTIEGVGTSTAAFIGPTRFGPVDGVPELLTSFGDFERIYAGIDRLDLGAPVDNYVAHGVRAFFENGGRRCYVTRVRHSSQADDAGHATTTVPTAAGPAERRLVFTARHPGRAGNFQVRLTLRLGANILDRSGVVTGLRGALEHQVVWLDRVDDGGTVRTGQFAQLDEVFDETRGEWTFDLLNAAASGGGFGDVSALGGDTTQVRVLSVDVEVGRLGEFLDPVFRGGLGLAPQDRHSLQHVFAPTDRADRSTELSVPLVVTTENIPDGPALADLLVTESGAAAGLTGTGVVLSLVGARGGTFALRVGTAAAQDVDFDATDADVLGALPAGSRVSGPAGGPWVIALSTDDAVTVDPTNLSGRGTVDIHEGTVWTVTPNGQNFRLTVNGHTTGQLRFNTGADDVDDALEEILGVGQARVTRSTGPLRFEITLFGGHGVPMAAAPPAVTVSPEQPVTEVGVTGDEGTFTFVAGGLASVPIDPTVPADVIAALQASLGTTETPVEMDGAYLAVLTTPPGPTTLTADTTLLAASTGAATATVVPVSDPLTNPGATASVQARLSGGTDGPWPDGDGYAGDDGLRKSGLEALGDLPDVSIVAAPGSTHDYALDRTGVINRVGLVIRHCERMRYRIAVIDAPPDQLPSQMVEFRGEFDSTHAALYYPWITAYDAVTRSDVDQPPSGFVAGIYARNDTVRGVHKAPANETIALSVGFETHVNTAQQELLNPLGINCLRHLDQRGRRVWGARTMTSDPEWKYVNLRRYFAFLEASIDRGTQWAVFEPNGELLWDNVRRTVEDFLLNEFASGHLLGSTPEESFFVRCDRSTMTQNDLDNGRLVCLIGVAPLRPAEFVVFRIGQKTLDVVA